MPNTPGYWRERRLTERLWRGCGVSAIERLLSLCSLECEGRLANELGANVIINTRRAAYGVWAGMAEFVLAHTSFGRRSSPSERRSGNEYCGGGRALRCYTFTVRRKEKESAIVWRERTAEGKENRRKGTVAVPINGRASPPSTSFFLFFLFFTKLDSLSTPSCTFSSNLLFPRNSL